MGWSLCSGWRCDVLKRALAEIVASEQKCWQLGLFLSLAVGEVRAN